VGALIPDNGSEATGFSGISSIRDDSVALVSFADYASSVPSAPPAAAAVLARFCKNKI